MPVSLSDLEDDWSHLRHQSSEPPDGLPMVVGPAMADQSAQPGKPHSFQDLSGTRLGLSQCLLRQASPEGGIACSNCFPHCLPACKKVVKVRSGSWGILAGR